MIPCVMSRREKLIRKVAAEAGITIISVRYEPIGPAMEMCGHSGGWIVNEGEFVGYSVVDVVQDIRDKAHRRGGQPCAG